MTDDQANERLATLKSFLEADPDNTALLRDAGETALAADQADEALSLFDRLAGLRALDPSEANLSAIAAMRSGDFDRAVAEFAVLRESASDEPALDFNYAHALALAGRHEEAEEVLSEEAIAVLPQAATLQVQLAHQAGRFDEAIRIAQEHLERFPDYGPLLANVSVLAMDVEDVDLARQCAEAAPDHPDGQTTLGLLLLRDSQADEAKQQFERALAMRPDTPRAIIGLGLVNLVSGDAAGAGKLLDQGAESFGTHLGSWIASGWCYLLSGDVATARKRFEHALEIDPNFAESHGSLAVIDILDGQIEEGKRKCETALRLDRQCFSASFANVLFAAGEGDQERASRIFELALRQPIAGGDETLADAIAKMAI